MKKITIEDAVETIASSSAITFLTGAGVSTPSGIPDYRSLKGIYHGIEQPEYLLSVEAMRNEPQKFYSFVKNIYHPKAEPNVIHLEMARLVTTKNIWVVSQNIDGLHRKARSQQLVDFHGNLYHCYCRKCGQSVSWQTYLQADRHENCGGQLRPAIVLYGEGFSDETIEQSILAVQQASLIVIVGTSFQVHPFCDLIQYRSPTSRILVINQEPIRLTQEYDFLQTDGTVVFEKLAKRSIL
ncbi:NAD-dependent protein deacylase [Enterococcus villorum]|uniref:protein acetyllysine N-acetyltransferase n=1 Tax=Enterococcus villorum TaxID=112904 RepID=A0A1V8YTU2_9ENTE|nr:NAD-dependent protein deacylase [Enterococcus villorum]OQO68911.1 NAD-dependent protein deacylase [Enterococcus villorum]OQO76004.1 NAD-dependent protein deacylase [Enterococcus villorum]